MQIAAAYSFVVIVWSTTPLAIQWSNSSLSFVAAVSLRMVFALAICLFVLAVLRRPLVKEKKDWLVFAAAALSFFPTMLLVYWAAQYIPSGLIAVLFGLYPFAVGFFSLFILNENIFNIRRLIALTFAVVGLIIVNGEQLLQGDTALLGVLGVLLAVTLFGLSSAWLKSIGAKVDPIRQTTGSLVLATPLLLLSWFFLDGELPALIDLKSMIGVSYLAIAGSVLSHTAFFYVVTQCTVASVGLITLITPIIAMSIAIFYAGETFSDWTIIGSSLIIVSLAVYQGAGIKLFSYGKGMLVKWS